MKNWRDVYKGKAVSAAEAVSHIRSGNRVVVGHATGSHEVLLKAMVENREAYKNVELVHMVSMGASEYCLPGMEKHFVHNSLFAGATTRLEVLSPLKTLSRGYAIATTADGAVVSDTCQLAAGDRLRVHLLRGRALCRVEDIENPPDCIT